MSNDVKVEGCPFCGGEARVHSPPSDYAGTYVMCGNYCAKTQRFVRPENAITTWNTRHQPQREAILEEAAKACEEQQRIFASPKYAAGQPMSSFGERFGAGRCAEAIRALKTTPVPAVSKDDEALLTDIFDKMAEVVAPLPGIPDAPGQHAGTRAIEPSDGDEA